MSKDRQHSKVSLPTNVEPAEIHNNNNGDLKHSSTSPMVLMKRPSEIIPDGGIELTGLIEKSLPDVLSLSKIDGAVGNGHGIISPFETLNNEDSDSDDAIVDHPHQQLSSSSSASVNILMDSNSNNKMMGNVQVSQV